MTNHEITEFIRRFPETFATLREYIEKLERENAELQRELAALKINYAQDKENYQCAARAGMAVEEKLKHENETLLAIANRLIKNNGGPLQWDEAIERDSEDDYVMVKVQDFESLCAALDTARKEQHERKIKQMTDAASLDIGHSCLSGDKWMRGDPI